MNFSQKLLKWYDSNKRELPWRSTDNPYVIWIAEVIFQQTRIDQGLPYFEKFIQNFPNVETLANSQEEKVLKLWQGLGYYSRARNLHFTAKYITEELNGKFPDNYIDLLKLKGIGPYIAAEIASVCFSEPRAAVDGNVQRVISIIFGAEEPVNEAKGKKMVELFAQEHLNVARPGDFNQALMDYGSSICSPKSPMCSQCIFADECVALREDKVKIIPLKTKKIKVKERFFNYLIHLDKGKIRMRRRGEGDIWNGLYEPVLYESNDLVNEIQEMPDSGYLINSHVRILSHQKIKLQFWYHNQSHLVTTEEYEWVNVDRLDSLPVPKSIEQLFSSKVFRNLINGID